MIVHWLADMKMEEHDLWFMVDITCYIYTDYGLPKMGGPQQKDGYGENPI